MRAVSASSAITVGSSPQTSSPTSASAIARRISGVGRVTVSERRSTGRIARQSILPAVPRRAADYPPPVRVREFVAAPEAGEDERIDVGVLFVGGGPAGMAGAIRLGQLLADDPATAEALGETPVAVVDKGRVAGAHLLSGAVVNPSALRDLLPETPLDQLPGFGPVRREAVYLMRPGLQRAAADAAALPQQGQLDLLAGAARPLPR